MQRNVRLCGSAVRRGSSAFYEMMQPSAYSGDRLWSNSNSMISSTPLEQHEHEDGTHSRFLEAYAFRLGRHQIPRGDLSVQRFRHVAINSQPVDYHPVWRSSLLTSPAMRSFHAASSSRWHGPLLMKHRDEDEKAAVLQEGEGDVEEEDGEEEGSSEFDGEEWSEEELEALKRLEASESGSGELNKGIPDVTRGNYEHVSEQDGESEGESEGDGLPDALAGLGSQLQGMPKRVQRFVVRKMMKVKPVEPPSMNHMKRVSEGVS